MTSSVVVVVVVASAVVVRYLSLNRDLEFWILFMNGKKVADTMKNRNNFFSSVCIRKLSTL